MAKVPTRSPTHEDLEIRRLASMGLELEEIAEDEAVDLKNLIEMAEDRGRPASHYLAAVSLATELRIEPAAPVTVKVCVGTCQRYGALDLLDHLAARWEKQKGFAIATVSCMDRCDQGPVCSVDGSHGQLVLERASAATVDEALAAL